MHSAVQNKVAVVLVRARNPANIGAVARAMHDFGYSDLRIVNEYAIPFQAAKSAVDASSVLQAAQEFRSVGEAVADCEAVYGTTAVGDRVLEHRLETLHEAAPKICAHAHAGRKTALLFGSEKTGLSNDELSHATALLTIPMSTREGHKHLSMNLGQATAVVLYTIAQADVLPLPAEDAALPGREEIATAGDMERLTSMLREVLARSGYARRHPANAREASVRRMTRRMGLTPVDAAVWTGVLRQMLHVLPAAAASNEEDGIVGDSSRPSLSEHG